MKIEVSTNILSATWPHPTLEATVALQGIKKQTNNQSIKHTHLIQDPH